MSSRFDPSISVNVCDVTLRYHKNLSPVLDSVNTRVTKGSIYCLLGPSGCGKTSLLKVIDENNHPSMDSDQNIITGNSQSPFPGQWQN